MALRVRREQVPESPQKAAIPVIGSQRGSSLRTGTAGYRPPAHRPSASASAAVFGPSEHAELHAVLRAGRLSLMRVILSAGTTEASLATRQVLGHVFCSSSRCPVRFRSAVSPSRFTSTSWSPCSRVCGAVDQANARIHPVPSTRDLSPQRPPVRLRPGTSMMCHSFR